MKNVELEEKLRIITIIEVNAKNYASKPLTFPNTGRGKARSEVPRKNLQEAQVLPDQRVDLLVIKWAMRSGMGPRCREGGLLGGSCSCLPAFHVKTTPCGRPIFPVKVSFLRQEHLTGGTKWQGLCTTSKTQQGVVILSGVLWTRSSLSAAGGSLL